jgi:Tol biopolymer transport system component
MKTYINKIIPICTAVVLFSCDKAKEPDNVYEEVTEYNIYPDYKGVTIPKNIAPLTFDASSSSSVAVVKSKDNKWVIECREGRFRPSKSLWREITDTAAGDSLTITLYEEDSKGWKRYAPLSIYVSEDRIDPYLVYRKLAPGYTLWNCMGIYQRNVENYDEVPLMENKLNDNNCMNCHTFRLNDPKEMIFHQRKVHDGTYIKRNGKQEQLTFRMTNGEKVPSLTYMFWHPSGRYVAFSSNDTHQNYHSTDKNRIEVYDSASDIYVYDMNTKELFTSPLLKNDGNFQTYPAFSPDGKSLYYCSAEAKQMPEEYDKVKYNLLRLDFDPESKTFGNKPDTIYNAVVNDGSAKFPRISPDGKRLMYTVSSYGNFSIWHRDADLKTINLETMEEENTDAINSDDVDSYHSWDSSSRWVVIASRRENGLYTQPYIAHVDERGNYGKPFLLPQSSTVKYKESLISYNLPEFIKEKVR